MPRLCKCGLTRATACPTQGLMVLFLYNIRGCYQHFSISTHTVKSVNELQVQKPVILYKKLLFLANIHHFLKQRFRDRILSSPSSKYLVSWAQLLGLVPTSYLLLVLVPGESTSSIAWAQLRRV